MNKAGRTPRNSAKRWGAARGDEVAIRVEGVFQLHMGMERQDRCERIGLQTDKSSMALSTNWIKNEPGWWTGEQADE